MTGSLDQRLWRSALGHYFRQSIVRHREDKDWKPLFDIKKIAACKYRLVARMEMRESKKE